MNNLLKDFKIQPTKLRGENMLDDLTRSVLEQRNNIENQRNRELNSNREHYIKQLEQRIDKALKKINNMFDLGNEETIIDDLLELEKILKGETNEK